MSNTLDLNQRVRNSEVHMPKSASMKRISILYSRKINSFTMKDFHPDLSKMVILSTDIRRMLEQLSECPHSHLRYCSIISVIVFSCLFVGSCKNHFPHPISNLLRGLWIRLRDSKFLTGLVDYCVGCGLPHWHSGSPRCDNHIR